MPTGRWRSEVGFDDVERAARLLADVVATTPLQRVSRLSCKAGAEVFLKREDLQEVRSYKIRGAFTFVAGLSPDELARGVVCASAGNHAQGVASACRRLGVRGTVFLPGRTPRQKAARIATIGGELVDIRFAGDSFDAAAAAAGEFSHATGTVVVPAFDHPLTIAGQGTVMLEAVQQLGRAPDVAVVPVGGGGLAAGSAIALDGLGASTRLLGVQPAGAPAMVRSLEAGHQVTVDIEDDFVDGAVVRTPGRLSLAVVGDLVHDMVIVDEGAVCTAMLDLYQEEGIIAEPAGALAVAAIDQLGDRLAGTTVICVLSGGNNDVARYGEIVERSLVHRGLKHYFVVDFPQRPGALREFLDGCLGPNDDIVLFEYTKKNNRSLGPALVGIELAEAGDLDPLLDRLERAPLSAQRLPPDSALFRLLV